MFVYARFAQTQSSYDVYVHYDVTTLSNGSQCLSSIPLLRMIEPQECVIKHFEALKTCRQFAHCFAFHNIQRNCHLSQVSSFERKNDRVQTYTTSVALAHRKNVLAINCELPFIHWRLVLNVLHSPTHVDRCRRHRVQYRNNSTFICCPSLNVIFLFIYSVFNSDVVRVDVIGVWLRCPYDNHMF